MTMNKILYPEYTRHGWCRVRMCSCMSEALVRLDCRWWRKGWYHGWYDAWWINFTMFWCRITQNVDFSAGKTFSGASRNFLKPLIRSKNKRFHPHSRSLSLNWNCYWASISMKSLISVRIITSIGRACVYLESMLMLLRHAKSVRLNLLFVPFRKNLFKAFQRCADIGVKGKWISTFYFYCCAIKSFPGFVCIWAVTEFFSQGSWRHSRQAHRNE